MKKLSQILFFRKNLVGKKLILLCLGLLNTLVFYAQGDEINNENSFHVNQESELLTNPTVQPPDVAAFQKTNFIPVNNYTGRVQVNIPIFTIQTGNITVPISLSYNSSGVKVNDIPSSVGSNWSLNAGGVVSKIVKGGDDFEASHNHINNWVWGNEFCHNMGFVFSKYHHKKLGYDEYDLKSDPSNYDMKHIPLDQRYNFERSINSDLFIVSAPGLSTKYIHTIADPDNITSTGSNGDILELTGMQNKIEESFGIINSGMFLFKKPSDFTYYDGVYVSECTSENIECKTKVFGIENLKITSISGLVYEFKDSDVSQSINKRLRYENGNLVNSQVDNSNLKQESLHLNSIKDLKTKKEVIFEYESYRKSSYDLPDSEVFFDGDYHSTFQSETPSSLIAVKYPKLNRLTKITFEKGSVEFIYGLNRQDDVDEKALTEVVIKDYNGKIIKKVKLEYSYKSNSSFASSPQNKRLQLDKVYNTSFNDEALPEYIMTYNDTALPPRGVWGKDFLGYHNGSYNASILSKNAKPNVYFYPEKKMYSFLPTFIGQEEDYYLISGNYSLASNLTYTKAGVLEKIQYPTGGFSEFEYELNQFRVGNKGIAGGGLRIKTQKIIDENGNEQILDYEYKEANGSSSGAIVSMPNFIDFRIHTPYVGTLTPDQTLNYFSFKTYRSPQTQIEFTNSSFVGYSRVVVRNRKNMGYSEYKYNSPNEYPNLMHDYEVEDHENDPFDLAIATLSRKNGKRSSSFDKDIYRGKLTSESIFNNNDEKIRETINTYTYKKFEEYLEDNEMRLCTEVGGCINELYRGPVLIEKIKHISERYLLTSSATTDYFGSNNITTTSNTTYDLNYPLVKTTTVYDGAKTITKKLYYPTDKSVLLDLSDAAKVAIDSLKSQNRFEVIQTESYKNNTLLATLRTNYSNNHNNADLYLPLDVQTLKGIPSTTNLLETKAIYHKYDTKGNPVEVSKKDGTHIVYLWGYNQTQPIAKIERAKLSVVNSAIANISDSRFNTLEKIQAISNNDADNSIGESDTGEGLLRKALNKLREALPNAQVTTYTYNPLIGVTSITDPRGESMYYEYDNFNRLAFIKNAQGNIIKEHKYNYKN